MTKNILITGGAGYIGSHMVLACLDEGFDVIVIDDFSRGHKSLIPKNIKIVNGSIGDSELVRQLLKKNNFDAVIHFAASISVPESVIDPIKYYINNTANTAILVRECVNAGVKKFIFSSTAAVYGSQETKEIKEDFPPMPDNAYGMSKLMSEKIIQEAGMANGLNYAILRYFNVAGADKLGRSGQISKPATHLIKIASELACNLREKIEVYGIDYPTQDGTCVRDYVHVADLISAHVLSLKYLFDNNDSFIANCGYGVGHSVLDVLNTLSKITGKSYKIINGPRRSGDVSSLVASSDFIKTKLSWKPRYNHLETIIKDAIDWEKKLI